MKKMNRSLTVFLTLALVCVMSFCGGVMSGRGGVAETTVPEPVQDTSPAIYVTQKNANSVVGVLTNEQTWNRSSGQIEDTLIGQGSASSSPRVVTF